MSEKNNYTAEHLAVFNAIPEDEKPKKEVEEEPDAREKMIDQAFSIENMTMRTELNQKQINMVLKLEMFAKHYKSDFVATLSNLFMQLQVSKGRQGRKEFKEMAQSILYQDQGMMGMPPMGIGGRFMGKE